MQMVFGSHADSKHIATEIQRLTGVGLHSRGSEITLDGAEASDRNLVERLLRQILELNRAGRNFASHDVARALEILSSDPQADLKRVYEDVVVAKEGKNRKGITPRSLAQKVYVDAMRERNLTFCLGPAGTGKTYLAVAMAVRRFLDKQVRRIILTRPAIEAGESLGFLPGTLEEKVSPYMQPLYDALIDMLDHSKVQRLMEQGVIEVAPLAYMRGRTLSDAAVILDEAQNTTQEQMKMLLTRIGSGTWCVVTGDPTQTDLRLPHGQRNGLVHASELLKKIPAIAICRFSRGDVMRHPLVQDILKAYDGEKKQKGASRKNGSIDRSPKELSGSGKNGSSAHLSASSAELVAES